MRKFTYIPLMRRLLLQLKNPKMQGQLSYALNYITSRDPHRRAGMDGDVMRDIFDGQCFNALLSDHTADLRR